MATTHGTAVGSTGNVLDKTAIDAFKSSLRGDIICPEDESYEHARKVWNGMINKHPAIIARCTGVADVVQAITFARAHDLMVAIRCGSHNAAGHATCDGGLVIDLTPMKGIRVDPRQRRVHAQGGVNWGELDRETAVYGLATTGGTVNDTGIAGLTLGGGIGWLMGKYGLSCDNVVSADVVTADGKVITANEHEHEDLFWALRGGGGNFGVVTSFEYQLHRVDQLLAGMVIYPRSHARDVLRYHRDFSQSAPDEVVSVAGLMTSPDGDPVIAIPVCYNGPLAEGEKVLEKLRNLGTPLADDIGPRSYVEVQNMLDPEAFPHHMERYWKSSFLKEPNDDTLDMILEYANREISPMSMVLFYLLHGAASRVSPDATAFGLRDELWNLDIIGQWLEPSERDHHIQWVREGWNALEPYATGGVYVNHLGEDESERVRAAFGNNYERLVAVKQKYDPTNFFRLNQNIKPMA